MKKWMTSIGLATIACTLSGCATSAVMLYVHNKRNSEANFRYKTREQVRSCMGAPKSIQQINGLTKWEYHYRIATNRVCQIQLYFKNTRIKTMEFVDVTANGSQSTSACSVAKTEINKCMKRFLVVNQ